MKKIYKNFGTALRAQIFRQMKLKRDLRMSKG
jgi:hypothetical protein